jgi:PST family polysaccharide transporter
LTFLIVPLLFLLGYSESVVIVILAIASAAMLDSITSIAWVQLDKALLFTRTSLVTALVFPISYAPAFYLALNGGGYWALVAQNITYAVLLLVGIWLTARRALPEIWRIRWKFSLSLAKQFLGFGVLVGLATIFTTLIYQFDNFLVGTIVNVDALGYYDRAYRIAQWSYILVGGVLARTAFYAYSRLQYDMPRLTKTATMSIWIVTVIAFPIALAIFISADNLVLVLFGEKWLPSAILLRILVIYSILRPFLDDAGVLFIATGHPRRATIVTIIQALVLVLAATPLTFRFGAVGTAIGVGVAFGIGLIVTYYLVRRTLPQLSLRGAFLVPTIAAVSTLVLAWFASDGIRSLPLPSWLVLVLQLGITIGLYLGITLLLRPQLTVERAQYVWRLFRHRESITVGEEPGL